MRITGLCIASANERNPAMSAHVVGARERGRRASCSPPHTSWERPVAFRRCDGSAKTRCHGAVSQIASRVQAAYTPGSVLCRCAFMLQLPVSGGPTTAVLTSYAMAMAAYRYEASLQPLHHEQKAVWLTPRGGLPREQPASQPRAPWDIRLSDREMEAGMFQLGTPPSGLCCRRVLRAACADLVAITSICFQACLHVYTWFPLLMRKAAPPFSC